MSLTKTSEYIRDVARTTIEQQVILLYEKADGEMKSYHKCKEELKKLHEMKSLV